MQFILGVLKHHDMIQLNRPSVTNEIFALNLFSIRISRFVVISKYVRCQSALRRETAAEMAVFHTYNRHWLDYLRTNSGHSSNITYIEVHREKIFSNSAYFNAECMRRTIDMLHCFSIAPCYNSRKLLELNSKIWNNSCVVRVWNHIFRQIHSNICRSFHVYRIYYSVFSVYRLIAIIPSYHDKLREICNES